MPRQPMVLNGVSVTLCNKTITTALTKAAQETIINLTGLSSLALQAIFTYGSGGTSAKAYVQTSLDGGVTWVDIACFAFTTTTATKVSALTMRLAPATQAFAPTNGTLTDDTVVNGVIGDRIRVILTTVGTYAGSTTLVVRGFAKS